MSQNTLKPFEGPDGAALSISDGETSEDAWTAAYESEDESAAYPLQWDLTNQHSRAVECITLTVDGEVEMEIHLGRQVASGDQTYKHVHRHTLTAVVGESYPISRTIPLPHNPTLPCGKVILINDSGSAVEVSGADIGFRGV